MSNGAARRPKNSPAGCSGSDHTEASNIARHEARLEHPVIWIASRNRQRLGTRVVQAHLPKFAIVLAVLARVALPVEMIVVDGYVWLGAGRPGLGAKLYDALEQRTPVVGVAKTAFRGNDVALPVLRGTSLRPLFVTAVGVDPAEAAACVRGMHGDHRIPTLLARVDQMSRT